MSRLRACLHGGGGPQVGAGNMWWVTPLTCKRDEIKMRDHMDRRVNPPRQVPRLHVKTPLSTSCKEGMKLCGNYG